MEKRVRRGGDGKVKERGSRSGGGQWRGERARGSGRGERGGRHLTSVTKYCKKDDKVGLEQL